MEKIYKVFKLSFALITLVVLLSTPVFGVGELGKPYNPGHITQGQTPESLKRPVNQVFEVVTISLQVASLAGVIFAGVTYMFTSSEGKSEVKKKLVPLVIGIVLVFGGATVVRFVVDSFAQVAF